MANVDLVMRLLAEDKASDKFKKVGQSVDSTQSKMGKFGRVAAGAIAGIGVAAFAKSSVMAFADVQDAQSALQATYGKTADAFIDFANQSADAFNLSKREALQAAQSFANFGRAAGLSGKQLEQFTTPLIERAADAASYFGGTTKDAVEAFGAALRGEMEPIRRYGVLLDDATLRNQALKMGLIDTVKNALTPQQKALAAQALILEQTAQVQGDVARTSDSMANQIKDAQQQMEDFQSSVGETLSVALGPLLGALNKGMAAFNGLPQPVKSAAVAIGVVGGAITLLLPKIANAKTAAADLGLTTEKMGGRMKLAAKGAGVLAAAMAVSSVVNSFSDATVDAAENVDALGTALDNIAGGGDLELLGRAFTTNTGRAVDFNEALGLVRDNHWWDQLETGIGKVVGQSSNLGMATEAVKALDSSLASMVKDGKADKAAAAIAALGISTDEAGQILPDYTTALKNAGNAADDAVQPTDDLTSAVDDAKVAVANLDKAWKLFNGTLSRQEAKDAAIQAAKSLDAALEKNGDSFKGVTDKALDNRAALRDAMRAVEDHVNALSTGPAKAKAYEDGIARLRDTLKKQGLSKKEQDALLEPLLKAKDAVDDLKRAANKTVTLKIQPRIMGDGTIQIQAKGGGRQLLDVEYRAGGGPVRAGRPYIVGERQAELFVPSTNGTILPSVGGMGGGTANVNVYLDGRLVQTSLVDLERQQGGRLLFGNR